MADSTADAPALDDLDAIRRDVAAIQWFHRIPLAEGLVTPGLDDTPEKIRQMNIPMDLTGKTVLDIGSWDGGIAFECERRGAARVLATDHFCWRNGRKGFDLAHRVLRSRVEALDIPVEEIGPERVGMFDVVLFLGVLYHAPDPLGYLRRVRSVCREYAIIETSVDAMDYPRPALVFYEGATLNGDPTNFFGPNKLAVEAMCREVGFSRVEQIGAFYGNRMSFQAWV